MGGSLPIQTRIVESYCLSATLIAMEGFYTLVTEHNAHAFILYNYIGCSISDLPQDKWKMQVNIRALKHIGEVP